MATDTQASEIRYIGNGSTVIPYPVPFRVLDTADIRVFQRTNLEPAAAWEDITGSSGVTLIESTGFAEVTTFSAWDSESDILIQRQTPITQPLRVPEAGKMPSGALESAYDRQTCISQELDRKTASSLRFPDGMGGSGELQPLRLGFVGLTSLLETYVYSPQELIELLYPPPDPVYTGGVTTFASAAIREATLPVRTGQIGVQTDENSLWVSDSETIGDWVKYVPDPTNSDTPLAVFGNRMAEGTAVSIYVFGDSTHKGYLQGDTIGAESANPTPVQAMQTALRSYYNNTAATVVNKSVSAKGVNYGLSIIDAELAAMPAEAVVRIAYMTNNASGLVPEETMLANEYAEKLRELVRRIRAAGKVAEFETGLPILPYGGLGTQTMSERAKQFAETMRAVGRELGVPLQDTHAHFEGMLNVFADSSLLFSDGIHLTQLGYTLRGYWMANTYMRAPVMPVNGLIPAVDPTIRQYGGANTIFDAAGSATGRGRIAAKIRIPIEVRQPGTDIYLATPIWSNGGSSVTVKNNGATVWTGSLNAAALVAPFAVDHELMVIENAAPGIHLIEMDAAAQDAGLYYVLARPTRRQFVTISGVVAPTAGIALVGGGDLTVVSAAGGTGNNHVLSDISASSSLRALIVEVTATFAANQGFVVHGRRSSGGGILGGILIYVDGTNGYLAAATGESTGYGTATILGSTDLRNTEHVYRAVAALNGDVAVYVDGALIGTYTPTIAYRGGRVGVYSLGASTTATIKNIKAGG